MNPEIESRTGPTPLDILIAFFGGVAGIISGSRKDKSNAIPGVAIATALMPPLCVAGFGLANGDMKIFLNSFYLFFLNSTFVVLATYLIVRYLDFPYTQHVNIKEKRKAEWIMVLTSLILIVPSLFIFLNVYKKTNTEKSINLYLKEYFGERYKYLDESTYLPADSSDLLVIKMYGSQLELQDEPAIKTGLETLRNIDKINVEIIPTSEIDVKDIKAMEAQITGLSTMKDQFSIIKKEKSQSDLLIEELTAKIDSIKADSIPFQQICNELKPLFPDIQEISISQGTIKNYKGQSQKMPLLYLKWPKSKSNFSRNLDEGKLSQFIMTRAQLDTIKVVSE
jgi:uncharacterized membrane protein